MNTTPEMIAQTAEFQTIKCPVKQRFLKNRHTRNVIDHAIIVSKNRGYEYWKENYSTSDSVKRIVRELTENN